jgi:hypothetical protein
MTARRKSPGPMVKTLPRELRDVVRRRLEPETRRSIDSRAALDLELIFKADYLQIFGTNLVRLSGLVHRFGQGASSQPRLPPDRARARFDEDRRSAAGDKPPPYISAEPDGRSRERGRLSQPSSRAEFLPFTAQGCYGP